MTRLYLRRGHDRRLRGGHPWIFSNEIDRLEGEADGGAAVAVHGAGGEFLGTGYFNGRSLIAARLLTRRRESIDTVDFFRARLEQALNYRQTLYPGHRTLRLVHGEGDGLPGLVVDRFENFLSVQLLTLGMETRRDLILAALEDLLAPRGIIARNDVPVRELEGLDQRVELLRGEAPPARLATEENGLTFLVDLAGGQKTGHFLDQKENHRVLERVAAGRKVLDLFCYSGSWSVHAARYGAARVTGVDISTEALALAGENADANGFADVIAFQRADAFDYLRTTAKSGERFDTVILDPPAFVKSRKKLPEALKGYLTVNRRAMELVAAGGFLITCSCSHHLSREAFLGLLAQAAAQAGRTARLVEWRGQAPDHPVLPACPETDYLKCAVLHLG